MSKALITILNDDGNLSAKISGLGEDLINMLSSVMDENPTFRDLVMAALVAHSFSRAGKESTKPLLEYIRKNPSEKLSSNKNNSGNNFANFSKN